MTLPPLANVFAFHDPDPEVLDEVERSLRSRWPGTVQRLVEGWVTAVDPLPGSPTPTSWIEAGMLIAQGGDLLEPRLAAAIDLVDHDPDRLHELPGDFGFVRLRPRGGATVVRAPGGPVPFWTFKRGSRIAVSTRLDDLPRFVPGHFELDPLVHAIWTTGYALFPDDRSHLVGVTTVGRGRWWDSKSGRQQSWWNPRSEQLPLNDRRRREAHAEELLALLTTTLQRELDDNGNLLSLSGGMDSTALGYLATRGLGRSIESVSLLPTDDATYARERSYIDPLVADPLVVREHEFRLDQLMRLSLMDAAPNLVIPVIHPVLGALEGIAAKDNVKVLFGGEYADEVCGAILTMPDWCLDTPWWRALRILARPALDWRDPARWCKHRVLRRARRQRMPYPERLPTFVRPQLQHEYSDWWNDRRARLAADRRPWAWRTEWTSCDGFVAMGWEACSAFGIRRHYPFFGRDVLELSHRTHADELIGPGTKRLLRAALAPVVPRPVLDRTDKGRWQRSEPTHVLIDDVALPESVVDPVWWASTGPGSLVSAQTMRQLKQLGKSAIALRSA